MAKKWAPTHTVPDGGLQTFVNNQPSTPLDPGLEVKVAETSGDWARVVASNGWECWVQASALVSLAGAAAAAAPVAAAAAAGPPPSTPTTPEAPTVSATTPPPPAQTPPAGASPGQPKKKGGPPWIPILIGVIVVLLLVGAGGGGYFLLNANAADVSLEMASSQSAQPFAPDIGAAAPASSPSAPPAATPSPAPKGPNGVAIYGGSGNDRVCDKQKLIDFLTSHPSEAAAWAGVEGITTAQIPDFIRALTPQILSQDMRVTNHGYANGKATTYQSAFQAGTAVLVNQYGYPVVRCLCGNPLTPAVSGKKYHYTGQQWPGFNQTTIIVIVAPPGNVPNVPTSVPNGQQQAIPSPSPKLGSVAGKYTLIASNPSGACQLQATTYVASVTQNGNQITWSVPSQTGNQTALSVPGTIDPLGHFDLNSAQQGFTVSYKGNVDIPTGKWDGTYQIGGAGETCSLRIQMTKS